MAKVLLVQPCKNLKEKEEVRRLDSPTSLIYVGTAIEDKHEIKIYDRNIDSNDGHFISYFKEYKPDIVGMTSMTSSILYDLIHLGKLIKEISPKTIIVVGGPFATVAPESLLKEDYIDYIIRGEGEGAFLEFCDTFDKNPKKLGKLKNVNLNPLREYLDMDKLKLPNFNLVDIRKYEHFFINLSRGCPGNCSFCYNAKLWGKNGKPFVRAYNTEKAIQFFKELIEKYKIKVFSITDDNFITFKSRCLTICDYLKDKNLKFFCFGRADYVNDEIVKALKKAGCHTLQIGIESGSQRVLNFLNKGVTVQQNMEAIKCCERNGITCDTSLMAGITTETAEELNMTRDFIKKYKPGCPDLHIFNPLPGTRVFDLCLSKGLLEKPKTLEEWAEWTGDATSIGKIQHNTSEIPDEYVMKTAREIMRYHLLRNKIKRAVYWIKVGEFRHVLNSMRHFLRNLRRRYSG